MNFTKLLTSSKRNSKGLEPSIHGGEKLTHQVYDILKKPTT